MPTSRKGEKMYYEEKIIDGVLMYKTTPKGEWMVADGTRAD